MARTALGTLTSIVLALTLAGCGSSQHSSGGEAGGFSPNNGPAPVRLNPTVGGNAAPQPCPSPTPAPLCPPAAPINCNPAPSGGGDDGGDSSGGDTTSNNNDSDLVVEVTNTADVPVDVTAQTNDETLDCGVVNPGETISVDMGELPQSATLTATPTGTDGSGSTPTFEDDTIDLGTDYSDNAPIATIQWQDQSDTGSDGSGVDTSGGSGDTGSSGDSGTIDDGSTDASSVHAPRPAHASSGVFVGHTAPFASKVRKVTPKITHHAAN